MYMFYHLLGAVILIINKLRYSIFGYGRPRPFSLSEIDRAIAYDLNVVDGWLKQLEKYSGTNDLKGKNILELGPGADLGNAFIALARGAASYTAFDANPLAKNCPPEFYEKLFSVLAEKFGTPKNMLQEELVKLQNGSGRIIYICDKNFNLELLNNKKFNLFVSQAAFEHFDDVEGVIKSLTGLAESGAYFVAEIDLQTHTQAIRDRDPLNIYRFSDGFYNACHFIGIPNRVRPDTYVQLLKKYDWQDIKTVPLNMLDKQKTEQIRPLLNKKYASDVQLDYLSFELLAKR
jgi:hypothetical protein